MNILLIRQSEQRGALHLVIQLKRYVLVGTLIHCQKLSLTNFARRKKTISEHHLYTGMRALIYEEAGSNSSAFSTKQFGAC